MDSETRKEAVQKILVSVPDYIQKVKCDTVQWTSPFKCAVSSCQNFFLSFEERDKYPYKFHNFPLVANLCAIWKEKCGLHVNTDVSQLKVCSDHFSLDDYIRNYREEFLNPDFKRKLKPDAVPQNNIININDMHSDASNDGSVNFNIDFDEVKEAVDESELLTNKYDTLLREKVDMMRKINTFKKRIDYKVNNMKKLQYLLKDTSKSSNKTKNRKNFVREVFSDAQINLLLGKKKVYWSDDDLAKAFTLRHMGSKECYLYLKNQLNIPLPALSCVQKWAASCNSL